MALIDLFEESYNDDMFFDPIYESDNNAPEYNVDMSEKEAKRTLATLTQDIINHPDKEVNQYTANIYSNIITKNLLPLWAKGYRKFSIVIDPKQRDGVLEFKIPSMTQDFVSRFIEGREPISGFLHRNPEIKIRMSPSIFKTMEDKDDAFNFFKAAIKYYDSGVMRYSEKIMTTVMKLSRDIKHLISTSKLSGLVTIPMHMIFIFDNVKMNTVNTFVIGKEELETVTKFIKGIYTKYAAPEKEKKKIIDDLNSLIVSLKESSDFDKDSDVYSFAESVNDFYSGKFDKLIEASHNQFITENIDWSDMRTTNNQELRYIREKFGVKKLKKIPRDLVAYITIETESIRDTNDKMLIASYCLSKLEIVEWYIELLEVGSKKYIVPHSKPYLEEVHKQLLQCYKNIMAVKIKNPNDRPLLGEIPWPKGYEG